VPLEHAREYPADMLLEDAVQQRHQVERLHALLAKLPERDRELVALKYGADLSTREIAGVLNLTETNVSTLLYRLVGKLRAEWENDAPTE
jgi:RNA polymerase sigma-70 factor (ECF subfamily)